MRNKEIKIPSKEDEIKFCPYDGDDCPKRGRCFGEVTGAEDASGEFSLVLFMELDIISSKSMSFSSESIRYTHIHNND